MKTLEDERYVVIKCTVSEIWRDSFVLAYIACTSYPYIQSLPTLCDTSDHDRYYEGERPSFNKQTGQASQLETLKPADREH